MLELDDETFS
jgi:Cullin family